MESACIHCGESTEDETCLRCSTLLPYIIGNHESLRPDPVTSEAMNAALEPARDDSAAERWQALLDVLVFKQDAKVLEKADQQKDWDGYSRTLWIAARQWHYNRERQLWNENPPKFPSEFETPSGGRLSKERWGWTLDGERLPGPIPMADLADMLGSEDASVIPEFNDWDEMLRALAACCWRIDEEPTPSWVSSRNEPLVPLAEPLLHDFDDEGVPLFENLYHSGFHPFWHWAESVSEQDVSSHLMKCKIPGKIWEGLSYNLRGVTAAWINAIHYGWPKLNNQLSCPTMLVRDDRLYLLVRSSTGFTMELVPPDPAVWRFLIITALHPPNTPEGHLLRAIIWHWNLPTGTIQPDPPQKKALGFLRSAWLTSPKDFALAAPDSLLVQGNSGVAYRVKLVGNHGNAEIKVLAYPDMECARTNQLEMFICIQMFEFKGRLPLGDRLAAYMLALREDRKSASEISTLALLFNTWGNYRTQDRSSWEKMRELRPHGFVEVQHEEEDWADDDQIHGGFDPRDYDDPTDPDIVPDPVPDEAWQTIANAHGERMVG